jgi:hypothetical protein
LGRHRKSLGRSRGHYINQASNSKPQATVATTPSLSLSQPDMASLYLPAPIRKAANPTNIRRDTLSNQQSSSSSSSASNQPRPPQHNQQQQQQQQQQQPQPPSYPIRTSQARASQGRTAPPPPSNNGGSSKGGAPAAAADRFVPRRSDAFGGDGGAYPEIHVAQYPNNMVSFKRSTRGFGSFFESCQLFY